MKKTYLKPEAELISFYTEEDVTAVEDISGDIGTAELPDDSWL